jgi:hypothetical protein
MIWLMGGSICPSISSFVMDQVDAYLHKGGGLLTLKKGAAFLKKEPNACFVCGCVGGMCGPQ